MRNLNRQTVKKPKFPVKALQFGGGNFLRGFVGYLLDCYNEICDKEIGIAVIKATPNGNYQQWIEQDGLYHVSTKGIEQGDLVEKIELIYSVSTIINAYKDAEQFLASASNPDIKFIFSNTTESGLKISDTDQLTDLPPDSFPAKLTQWLYKRFRYFAGQEEVGCYVVPCELLPNNGALLQDLVLQTAGKWVLPEAFIDWIKQANTFCDTLVDRIVPGLDGPQLKETWAKIGFQDYLITEGEPYHLWVIEAKNGIDLALPLHQAGLNVIFTKDLSVYRKQKVRILNGAHTAIAPLAYLAGIRTVRDAVMDPLILRFMQKLLREEVLPILKTSPTTASNYIDSVIERFQNPFIDHYLASIALNSFSKLKSRLLPSLLEFVSEHKSVPPLIAYSFAATILFYRGHFQGASTPIKDDPLVSSKLAELWTHHSHDLEGIVQTILAWESFWGKNLSHIEGLVTAITRHLQAIQNDGIRKSLSHCVNSYAS